MSRADALRDAGYSEATALHHAADVVAVLSGRPEIVRIMDRSGLTDEYIVQRHREGLGASTSVWCGDKRHEVVDHRTRMNAVELGYEVRGHLRPSVGQQIIERVVRSIHVAVLIVPEQHRQPLIARIVEELRK